MIEIDRQALRHRIEQQRIIFHQAGQPAGSCNRRAGSPAGLRRRDRRHAWTVRSSRRSSACPGPKMMFMPALFLPATSITLALGHREGRIFAGGAQHHHAVGAVMLEPGQQSLMAPGSNFSFLSQGVQLRPRTGSCLAAQVRGLRAGSCRTGQRRGRCCGADHAQCFSTIGMRCVSSEGFETWLSFFCVSHPPPETRSSTKSRAISSRTRHV